ncbi:MAG: GGDEF domain-containing protein, partial [Solirubrobacteraceae bacterium]
MSQRLRNAEVITIGAFVVLAAVSGPYAGWGLLISAVSGGAVFALLIPRMMGTRRPEYRSVAMLAFGEVILAVGIVLSSGPRMLLLPILCGPALMGASVWPTRGVVVETLATAALIIGLAFGLDSAAVLHTPPLVLIPLAVLFGTTIIASAARNADIASRAGVVIDRLTGQLNRAALLQRASELEHQSAMSRESIAVLLGDIDHFKAVNDDHGHLRGDAALSAVGVCLREGLAAGGSLYRFGGEEFVVLLPGADLATATRLADSLRVALSRGPVDGLSLTMSFGVAATRDGRQFDLSAMLAAADRAL